MKTPFLILTFAFLVACQSKQQEVPKFEENWASLARHNEEPEWFKDAKLGIYFHWGVYSVPAFGDEWYPRKMYFKDTKEYAHHLEKYGDPLEFGYHNFVPMFNAENFNPEEWAALFKKAGARFAGPVAEHHDGFSMWASKATPWNSLDKGPHRDITGELEKAIRGQGMKFITTFHHARNLQRYADKPDEKEFWDSHFPYIEGTHLASDDPELKYLYGNIPESEWVETVWFGKLKEVIDNYQPDIIWFDGWLDKIPENYLQKFCAYYFNEAVKSDKEVVVVRKHEDLPLECSIIDLEKSRMNRLEEKTWMTDETLSTWSWCYTEGLEIKPAADVLHVLIDIVSKNGVLLLNISPMANGTIPADQQDVLLKMGEWLDKYGESVYDTRPWYTYGEGPTKEPEGHFKHHQEFLKLKYSANDIRFTTKGENIYATVLGWPDKDLLLKSFAKDSLPSEIRIKDVSMLGYDHEVKWNLMDEGLFISVPSDTIDVMANVFKIETL